MFKNYKREVLVIVDAIQNAYRNCYKCESFITSDKGIFDVVTSNDYMIEDYIIKAIRCHFPNDTILSEETLSDTAVENRTWTIDPIDGTYNMSRAIPLFGVQCSLYVEGKTVLAVIFLPVFNEIYAAVSGEGAFLNNERIYVKSTPLDHAIVSFGDFSHKRPNDFYDEQQLMHLLSEQIAKVRMFGAASIDFAYLASGKTDAAILFTKNKWDIAPGILIAKEAGAYIASPDGAYCTDSRAIIATSNNELMEYIQSCYKRIDLYSGL